MKPSKHSDPARWKDLPGTTAGAESDIAAATRVVHGEPPVDDLRLAHLEAQVARQVRTASSVSRRSFWPGSWAAPAGWRWARATALVLVSMLIGGAATAVTGRIIYGIRNSRNAPTAADSTPAGGPPGGRHATKTWRLKVEIPSELDVSVGADGTEMTVIDGEAALSGTDIAGTLDLTEGASWQERRGAEQPEPETARPAVPVSDLAVPRDPPPGPRERSSYSDGGDSRKGEQRQDSRTASAPGRRLALRLEEQGRRSWTATPQSSPNERPPSAAPAPPSASPIEPPPLKLPERDSGHASAAVAPALGLNRASPSPAPHLGEAALLSRAIGRLRRERDPGWALVDLTEHEKRFPAGSLRREAALVRAEALLALDRGGDALVVLDRLKLGANDLERRAQLARAELRAQEGRRTEAISDFDRVLARGGDDELADRALYGRAVCRVRGGDLGGARADLRLYLVRFAHGAHRGDVEKMLRHLGS